MLILKIDNEECGVCEDCIDVCPEEAIIKKAFKVEINVPPVLTTSSIKVEINENKCDDCGECVDICPVGAIYDE